MVVIGRWRNYPKPRSTALRFFRACTTGVSDLSDRPRSAETALRDDPGDISIALAFPFPLPFILLLLTAPWPASAIDDLFEDDETGISTTGHIRLFPPEMVDGCRAMACTAATISFNVVIDLCISSNALAFLCIARRIPDEHCSMMPC